eukprot:4200524-Pleurochrysis_carterae.AAC.1
MRPNCKAKHAHYMTQWNTNHGLQMRQIGHHSNTASTQNVPRARANLVHDGQIEVDLHCC